MDKQRQTLLKTYMSSLMNAVKIMDNIPIKPYWCYSNQNLDILIDIKKYTISFNFIEKNKVHHFTSDGEWVNHQGIKVTNLTFEDVKRVYDTSEWLLDKLENKNTLI